MSNPNFQQLQEEIVRRLQGTTPKEWGIAGGISFLLCMFYNFIVKSKNESAISFTVLLYVAVLTVTSVVVSIKKIENQYAWSVVILSLVSLVAGHSKAAPLFLAIAPPLVNWTKHQIKS